MNQASIPAFPFELGILKDKMYTLCFYNLHKMYEILFTFQLINGKDVKNHLENLHFAAITELIYLDTENQKQFI